MRYCHSCQKITNGEPSYCNYCGRSYDVKLCGRGHTNIRTAEVCSVCGSRDLSIPQSRPSLKMRIFQFFGLFVPFVVLLLGTLLYVAVFLKTLFQNPNQILPMMLIGLVLGLLWLFWILLSSMLRRLLVGSGNKDKRK